MHNINLGDIRELEIPVPAADEQEQRNRRQARRALRQKPNASQSIYERKLAALEALKKSLLHQAFTGQL